MLIIDSDGGKSMLPSFLNERSVFFNLMKGAFAAQFVASSAEGWVGRKQANGLWTGNSVLLDYFRWRTINDGEAHNYCHCEWAAAPITG
jgi:hypothetical protein